MARRENQASELFMSRNWDGAFTELSAAHRTGRLDGEDLERLAVVAYMTGRDDDCETAWIDAHHAHLSRGAVERAAGCAFWHALGLFFRGEASPATGWVARGRGLLEDRQSDCVERAWSLMLTALPLLLEGEGDAAHPSFVKAAEIAERYGDADAAAFARLGCGYALVSQGQIAAGVALLDEAMVAVTADEVAPMIAGIIYCQVIALCQAMFDVRRAKEWTDALTRWCDAQPGLVPFRGNCLIHRCEIFQLQGAWSGASEAARQACERLAGPPAWDTLGSAYYQLGEIQRLRGEFVSAEESYRQASLAGRDPEPGMSLLRMAQGRADLALSAIRRSLAEAQDPMTRSRLLPACVAITLEANDRMGAREAAEELVEVAEQFDVAYLRALGAYAWGAVVLAEGDPRAALTSLRAARRTLSDLGAPHHVAQARLLIGVACRELGDVASAQLEFDAARRMLEDLGAAPDLERLSRLTGPSPASGPLSPRESEVLALLATGTTNRAIADQLCISEKTVARHVSNIFTKLGLSSRSEATAYAYKRGLVH